MFQVMIALSFVSALLAPATVGAQQQPQANDPAYWGDDCFKIDEGTGDDTFRATRDYRLVVLKSGTVNDVFENVEAGDVLSTASGRDVSHLILCTDVVSTTTTTTTTTTGPTTTTTTTTTGITAGPTTTTTTTTTGITTGAPPTVTGITTGAPPTVTGITTGAPPASPTDTTTTVPTQVLPEVETSPDPDPVTAIPVFTG